MRIIQPDGTTTDMVECGRCGFQALWTQVDPSSPVPREAEDDVGCDMRIVAQVMQT